MPYSNILLAPPAFHYHPSYTSSFKAYITVEVGFNMAHGEKT